MINQAYQIEGGGNFTKSLTKDLYYEEIIRLVEDLVKTFFVPQNHYAQIPVKKQMPIVNTPSSPGRRIRRKRLNLVKSISSIKKRHLTNGALNLEDESPESENEDYAIEEIKRRSFSRPLFKRKQQGSFEDPFDISDNAHFQFMSSDHFISTFMEINLTSIHGLSHFFEIVIGFYHGLNSNIRFEEGDFYRICVITEKFLRETQRRLQERRGIGSSVNNVLVHLLVRLTYRCFSIFGKSHQNYLKLLLLKVQ